MQYQVVPYDPFPAAVAYAQNFVLNHRSTSSTAHANAFFRHLTSRPKIDEAALQQVIPLYKRKEYRYLSKDEILNALEIAIASNGAAFPHPLPLDLRFRLFPFQAHRRDQRSHHHIELQHTRNRKVKKKRDEKIRIIYTSLYELAEADITQCTKDTLGAWYTKWSEHDLNGFTLPDDSIRTLLKKWHRINEPENWPWDALYSSISTWSVVLDMQRHEEE